MLFPFSGTKIINFFDLSGLCPLLKVGGRRCISMSGAGFAPCFSFVENDNVAMWQCDDVEKRRRAPKTISSGNARAARGGSTRPDERFRSATAHYYIITSSLLIHMIYITNPPKTISSGSARGKGREHPPRRAKKHFPLSISQGRCPCDPTGFFVLTQKSRQKKSRLRPYRSKN
jgi:hypothetical protein